MFSGKTEELIRILRRSDLAGKKIIVVKPLIDVRSTDEIASRRTSSGQSKDFAKSEVFPAISIESAQELGDIIRREQPTILAIDEAQFFDPWLMDFLVDLMRRTRDTDLTVLVAGLDMDAWGRPFGVMPHVMALADEVQKETAICFQCKMPAMFTQKLGSSDQQVEVVIPDGGHIYVVNTVRRGVAGYEAAHRSNCRDTGHRVNTGARRTSTI